MARIAGVEIPRDKQVRFSLAHLYGIGDALARKILRGARVPETTRVSRLGPRQIERITAIIEREHVVEGELRRQVHQNVERLKAIRCRRGDRHGKGLPVRGQKTRRPKGPRKNSITVIFARNDPR